MKHLLSALALMVFSAFSHAGTLVQLVQPESLNGIGTQHSCAGVGFAADHSVYGICKMVTASACSGRGCQPIVVTSDYATTWDADGNPIAAVLCSVTKHHLPGADQVTYVAGYDATTCPKLQLSTGTTVGIPYGTQPWEVTYFYYVTTDVTGAELVNSNVWGFLYLP